jgi:hypothetical protein
VGDANVKGGEERSLEHFILPLEHGHAGFEVMNGL